MWPHTTSSLAKHAKGAKSAKKYLCKNEGSGGNLGFRD